MASGKIFGDRNLLAFDLSVSYGPTCRQQFLRRIAKADGEHIVIATSASAAAWRGFMADPN